MDEDYRVQLDIFSGPLDLLLFLIKREELDIHDVSVRKVADQYIEYVHLLEQIDPNAVGEFLVIAATLAELKSRHLLPRPPIEALDDDDDVSGNLIRELLEYKRFKEAAAQLGSAAEDRARRYARVPADLPKDDAAVELEDAQVWDLVSAFNRVMTAIGRGSALHEVTYDDTPIELWAEELLAAVATGGPTTFDEVFSGRRAKGELVGLFLALLELVRKKRLTAQQDVNFGTIFLVRLEEVADEDDVVEDDTPPRPIGPRLVQPEEDEQLETPRDELEPAPKDIAADEHPD